MVTAYKTQCILLKVESAKGKLHKLACAIESHFQKGQRILIAVQDMIAANYLNQWVWQIAENTSFFPHKIADQPCHMPLVITVDENNLNHATVLINLRTTPPTDFGQFKVIYELSDSADDEKHRRLQQRLLFYRAGGCAIWES